MLKTFVDSIKLVWQALTGCISGELALIRRASHSYLWKYCDSNFTKAM